MTISSSRSDESLGTDLVSGIAEKLRQQILAGELAPGERIFEAQLARAWGTSRAPLREASRLLEREGLLISQSNRGFLVREPTIRDMIETADLRACVESYAARRVVVNSKLDQLLVHLEQAAREIESWCKAGDRSAQVAADFKFHRLMVESAGNRRLLSVFDQIAAELKIAMRLMGMATSDWENLAQSHRQIIDVLRERDPEAAEKAVQQHIHLAWDETIEKLQARMDGPLRVREF